MIAADRAVQRPSSARLLVVNQHGTLTHVPRSAFVDLLRPGDLVVANDAATLPASLQGHHEPTGASIEVRLAGRGSLRPEDVHRFAAIVFGSGDFHTRTEDRPLPPPLTSSDRLRLGPLMATIEQTLGHPRLISLWLHGTVDEIWAGLARHGRPIQYAHLPTALALWDVWTPIAGAPVAFEPPSAGFAVDWQTIGALRARGVGFATLTHAAGISSTGDAGLDRRLPLDEPYWIPSRTARAIERTREEGGRVIAIGTTVVRALEHAATGDGNVRSGAGLATQRLGGTSELRVVDAILSGTHEPGTSHYDLLLAFVDASTLTCVTQVLDDHGYLTHEFGDSVLVERQLRSAGLKTGRYEERSVAVAAGPS